MGDNGICGDDASRGDIVPLAVASNSAANGDAAAAAGVAAAAAPAAAAPMLARAAAAAAAISTPARLLHLRVALGVLPPDPPPVVLLPNSPCSVLMPAVVAWKLALLHGPEGVACPPGEAGPLEAEL